MKYLPTSFLKIKSLLIKCKSNFFYLLVEWSIVILRDYNYIILFLFILIHLIRLFSKVSKVCEHFGAPYKKLEKIDMCVCVRVCMYGYIFLYTFSHWEHVLTDMNYWKKTFPLVLTSWKLDFFFQNLNMSLYEFIINIII